MERRTAASLDRVVREMRGVRLGQQALFAFVDSRVKTLLTCLAEPPTDVYEQAVARGKLRYDRFLKSVGAAMMGDSGAAMAELLKRGEQDWQDNEVRIRTPPRGNHADLRRARLRGRFTVKPRLCETYR
jgi:hypothetical protein